MNNCSMILIFLTFKDYKLVIKYSSKWNQHRKLTLCVLELESRPTIFFWFYVQYSYKPRHYSFNLVLTQLYVKKKNIKRLQLCHPVCNLLCTWMLLKLKVICVTLSLQNPVNKGKRHSISSHNLETFYRLFPI